MRRWIQRERITKPTHTKHVPPNSSPSSDLPPASLFCLSLSLSPASRLPYTPTHHPQTSPSSTSTNSLATM